MGEVLTFGIMLGGFLIMIGATFVGKRLLATTIAATFLGVTFEPVLTKVGPEVLSATPSWLRITGLSVVGLWILQALLTIVFGKKVADAAVGNIVSHFVVALARLGMWPFRWLRRMSNFIDRQGPED